MAVLISNGSSVPHASSNTDLALQLVRYLTGVGYPTFTGTGGVRLRYSRAKTTAVTETWTLVCTNVGAGTFSVTGSVSGAQSDATVGTPYDNGKVAFTLSNISGAPVLSDQIVFGSYAGTLVASGMAWELIKTTTPVANETHIFLRGLGNGGTDQICVGMRTYQNVTSDWYNIGLFGATGYIESVVNVASMPGVSPQTDLCLTNAAMPFWFIANGRRFMVVVKVSTVYQCAYAGFILPTGTPNEYPYPLAVGACNRNASQRWSVTGEDHRAFFNPGGSLLIREKGGAWLRAINYATSGTTTTTCTTPFRDFAFHTTIDGNYVLYPVTIHTSSPAPNVLGDFEGLFKVSGFSNPTENLVQYGGVDHLVVQSVYRTDPQEYAAFRLE